MLHERVSLPHLRFFLGGFLSLRIPTAKGIGVSQCPVYNELYIRDPERGLEDVQRSPTEDILRAR